MKLRETDPQVRRGPELAQDRVQWRVLQPEWQPG